MEKDRKITQTSPAKRGKADHARNSALGCAGVDWWLSSRKFLSFVEVTPMSGSNPKILPFPTQAELVDEWADDNDTDPNVDPRVLLCNQDLVEKDWEGLRQEVVRTRAQVDDALLITRSLYQLWQKALGFVDGWTRANDGHDDAVVLYSLADFDWILRFDEEPKAEVVEEIDVDSFPVVDIDDGIKN